MGVAADSLVGVTGDPVLLNSMASHYESVAASIRGARAVEVGHDGTVYLLERQGHSLRAVDPSTGTSQSYRQNGVVMMRAAK